MSTNSWIAGISADWSYAGGWTTGAVPLAGSQVMIAALGAYVVTLFEAGAAASLTLAAQGAEFYDAASLALSGTLSVQQGTLALAYGTITGGTLAITGGTLLTSGGMLNNVAVQGPLNLTAMNASLFVENGLAVTGANGTGSGSINLTGGYSSLDFLGSQTLNNAVVTLGAAGSAPGQSGPATLGVTALGGATTGATLTLGANLWLCETSGNGAITTGAVSFLPGLSLPAEVLNQGTITASAMGGQLAISGGGTFANAGTITVSNGDTLSIGSTLINTGIINVTGATLGFAGTFAASELASLGALTNSGGTIAILGIAQNYSNTLSLGAGSAITAKLGALALDGTIQGGAVIDSGGGLNLAPGTGVLDSVALTGSLNLSAANAGVVLTDGSEITAANGSAGIITDTGAGATLLLRGSETLTNASISLGNANATSYLETNDGWLASTATTATLAASVTVQQTGANAAVQASGASIIPGFGIQDTLINQGSITGGVAAGNLAISGGSTFYNQGRITVSNGDTLDITVQDFVNTGTLSAASGATIELGQPAAFFAASPAWSNSGVISVAGGTLSLGGTMQTSQLGSITEQAGAGSAVILAGTLNNAGSTLTLGPASSGSLTLPSLILAGTITGGTIADATGALSVAANSGALLDGLAYQGTLALLAAGASLRVRDTFSLAGALRVTGAGSLLQFEGSQTISNAQIALGAAGQTASIDLLHDPNIAGTDTLTLGIGTTLTQAGALATIGPSAGVTGDAIVNSGTINATTLAGTLTLGGPDFINRGVINVSNGDTLAVTAAAFANTGTIAVNSASFLALDGSLTLAQLGHTVFSAGTLAIAGSLNLGGGTLSIGTGTAYGRVLLTGTISNGTIIDNGGGLGAAASAMLNGVTYRGTIDLSHPFSHLNVENGINLTGITGSGAGSILLTGAQSELVASTTETFANTTITLGNSAQTYGNQHFTPAELAAASGATLTLASSTVLNSAASGGQLGDSTLGQWNDTIVNAGQITSSTALGTLTLSSTNFTNTGNMSAISGGFMSIGDANFTNTGNFTIGVGSTVLLTLYDFYADPTPNPTSFTNAGTINMGGVLVETTGGGAFPCLIINNLATGHITGAGEVYAPVSNFGTIDAHGGGLLLVQAIVGAGTLQIDAGSMMELQVSAGPAQQVQFTANTGTLRIDRPSSFAGTLHNFSTGDVVDLPGQTLTGISIANGVLSVNATSGAYRIASAAPLAGALSAAADIHGGDNITYTAQTATSGGTNGGAMTLLGVTTPSMLFWCAPTGDELQGTTANFNHATISDWGGADKIDMIDLSTTKAALTATQSGTTTMLSITDGTHTASFGLAGTFTASYFHLATDGAAGTMLTYSPTI